jgi:glycosyltransferase involved in cell wall biosynthesis
MNIPKISIIIPVFRVEKYIERCVRSLFEQTLDDIEYIFINDCTPDNSMMILSNLIEQYPYRKSQVKIIHHTINKGVSAARNAGLKTATGEYIIHCDSDDWVEKDMYESLYDKAIAEDADMVGCDFYCEYKKKSIYCKQYFNQEIEQCFRQMLYGTEDL